LLIDKKLLRQSTINNQHSSDMTQPFTPSSPTGQKSMVLRECGICQSAIFPDEATTTCPKCNLTFHAECWAENLGCASYGCDQVNALKPREADPEAPSALFQPIPQAIERLPWNFVLLGAAAISIALSSLTFGIPSALVFAAIVARIVQIKKQRGVRLVTQPILVLAAILALIGFIAGTLISRYWHFQ
jgi:hypothetical protein